jgi:DNA-binding response OmpR family regulator
VNVNPAQRILVAEDDRVLARIVKFNLSQAGFDVEVVNDGRTAVDRAGSEPFHLIVVDYQMPRLCGEDVCREVRSGTLNAETPFFF